MSRPPRHFLRSFRRALLLRCPKCGSRGIFRGLTMVEDCPGCGLHYERSPGYWLGAMTINLGVTMGLFLLLFIGGMVVLWPDVPWTAMTIVLVIVMAVTPVLIHPWSRLVWVTVERHFRMATEPNI